MLVQSSLLAASMSLIVVLSVSLLLGVNGQTSCSTVLSDLQPSDYTFQPAEIDANSLVIFGGFTATAGQTINALSTYYDASINMNDVFPLSVRLSLYTGANNVDTLDVAGSQEITFTATSASGVYSAPLRNSYRLAANTYYYIAIQTTGTFYVKTKAATYDAGSYYPNQPYSATPPSPLSSYNSPISYFYFIPIAAQLCTPVSSSSSSGPSSLSSSSSRVLGPASGSGDPLFTGFYGQQFYISGVDGQVMTVLASHNMQVNGRLVQLEDGQSMLPYEQDKLRQASELRLSDDPTAPAALPSTIAWTHPGTYFGECGVALFDDNRLHAKAGGYATGWAALTLNRRPLPVSDVPIVIGQGANTTYIHRSSTHHLTIRTATLQLTLVNSDHFLNIERVQLESGYDAKTRLGGILGGTANASWSWAPAVEADNSVASGDLFDRQQMDM